MHPHACMYTLSTVSNYLINRLVHMELLDKRSEKLLAVEMENSQLKEEISQRKEKFDKENSQLKEENSQLETKYSQLNAEYIQLKVILLATSALNCQNIILLV